MNALKDSPNGPSAGKLPPIPGRQDPRPLGARMAFASQKLAVEDIKPNEETKRQKTLESLDLKSLVALTENAMKEGLYFEAVRFAREATVKAIVDAAANMITDNRVEAVEKLKLAAGLQFKTSLAMKRIGNEDGLLKALEYASRLNKIKNNMSEANLAIQAAERIIEELKPKLGP